MAQTEPTTTTGKAALHSLSASLRPWLILILVCALFSSHPGFRGVFWTEANLFNVLQQSARNIVLAVGMSFVIFTGGIDLSVGSVLALSGVGMAMALSRNPPMPVWLVGLSVFPLAALGAWLSARKIQTPTLMGQVGIALGIFALLEVAGTALLNRGLVYGTRVEGAILIGLLIGCGCGLLNGLSISIGRVPPFVMTLGMMSAARGLTLYATNSLSVAVDFPRFRALGEGLPLLLITLLVVGLGIVLLRYIKAGRYILSTGGNEQATRLSGVPVAQYKTLAYILSGLGAAIGAIILTAKFGQAQTNAGSGAELEAIAAVVIGGTTLSGGQGSIIGALVGALTITVITTGLVFVRVEPNLQQVILGAIIVLTVFIDQVRRKKI